MSSPPSQGFLSSQKLSRKFSLGVIPKFQSKSQLDSFLLDDHCQPDMKKGTLSPIHEATGQKPRRLQKNKSFQNFSQVTQKRLLSELQKQKEMQETNNRQSDLNLNGFNFDWRAFFKFLKLVFLSYQFNMLNQMSKIDANTTQKIKDILKIAPGYKPVQYVFTFYLIKYNFVIGLLTAIIYPLPYSILFLMIPTSFQLPFMAIFILAGMRSGVLALLLKYCLHFPIYKFHWIIFLFTVFIGIFLPNNYIFICFYLISLFLSFYLKQETTRDKNQQNDSGRQREDSQSVRAVSNHPFQNNQQQQLFKQYNVYDEIPETYPLFCIGLLGVGLLATWIVSRYVDSKYLHAMIQILPISLLGSSKQMLAFFPAIYISIIEKSNFSAGTIIAASFLFPGPHSKAFMFVFDHSNFELATAAYTILYLPSILLVCIFLAYRPKFYTETYNNIRMSMQAVGNGIVASLVVALLREQTCFFNSVCYASIVIMVLAKLYKLRELFAITVGIFLILARTIILHVNKGISFEKQACLT